MKGENLAIRLRSFGAAIIRLCREIPDDRVGNHIARQLLRAATGGGANYEEARGAESLADFIHKVSVAAKELREAQYWLHLLREAEVIQQQSLAGVIREVDELIAILTASIRTSKERYSTVNSQP